MAGRVSRRAKVGRAIRRAKAGALPDFVPPQLTALTETAPEGGEWVHELKWDGYRMHARIDGGKVRLLTRTGLDWTDSYPAIVDALRALPVNAGVSRWRALRAVRGGPDLVQRHAGRHGCAQHRGSRLRAVRSPLPRRRGPDRRAAAGQEGTACKRCSRAPHPSLQFSEHHAGSGETFHRHACKLGIEGIVSKRLDCPYKPGDRGIWRKVKCLNREEFVVVGWTDPEGSRPHLGALLLAYYAPDGRLVYAGRAGTGLNTDQLRGCGRALDRSRPTDDAARRAAAAGQPVRLAARPLARALGPAGDGGRGHLSDLDGRQPAPPRGLSTACAKTSRRATS